MARSFTYKTRVNYLDANSKLVKVTTQYLGPEKILIKVDADTGKFTVAHYPIAAEDGTIELPQIPSIEGDETNYVMLDQQNDDHVILMDMISEKVDVNDPTKDALRKTLVFRTHTFEDGSTFLFRRTKPKYDDTTHTFSINGTTVNVDGTINFIRYATDEDLGDWLNDDVMINQIKMHRQKYLELYQQELSSFRAAEKEVFRKVCELCDVLIYDLIVKVPNWMITPPTAIDVTEGGNHGELALDTEGWTWGEIEDVSSKYM